jgi:hypothetical protein
VVIEESKNAGMAAAASAAAGPTNVVFNSKINALMDQLSMLRHSQPGTKALVFSQFTHTINTVAERSILQKELGRSHRPFVNRTMLFTLGLCVCDVLYLALFVQSASGGHWCSRVQG